jgi:hypothetical protein
MWVDGKAILLPGVRFAVPDRPATESWSVRSSSDGGASVALDFTPLGAREDHSEYGFIASDFVQPYGVFNGTVRAVDHSECDGKEDCSPRELLVRLEGAVGVVETHRAVW